MSGNNIYCAGTTQALIYAKQILRSMDFPMIDHADRSVGHLLLDIPSFRDSTTLRTGGNIDTLLNVLPADITIWGGNLSHPSTEQYNTVDLLRDELYLAKNAAITADCALQVASPLLTTTWQEAPALIIGWGRIGKCLSKLLKGIGNNVTVATRNPSTQFALQSMGYQTIDLQDIHQIASRFRILFNTAPEMIIHEEETIYWKNCIQIDLASQKGIAGEQVVWARGLPGIHAPESSGKLIAETICRLWKERNL